MARHPVVGDDGAMKEGGFASDDFAGKQRQTKRERFQAEMNARSTGALIEPHNSKSGKVARPTIGVRRMLRMYFLRQRCTQADEALEERDYDSEARPEVMSINFGRQTVRYANTLLKARRLLEQRG